MKLKDSPHISDIYVVIPFICIPMIMAALFYAGKNPLSLLGSVFYSAFFLILGVFFVVFGARYYRHPELNDDYDEKEDPRKILKKLLKVRYALLVIFGLGGILVGLYFAVNLLLGAPSIGGVS